MQRSYLLIILLIVFMLSNNSNKLLNKLRAEARAQARFSKIQKEVDTLRKEVKEKEQELKQLMDSLPKYSFQDMIKSHEQNIEMMEDYVRKHEKLRDNDDLVPYFKKEIEGQRDLIHRIKDLQQKSPALDRDKRNP